MIDGALLLDKPVGLSSNAALQKAKRILQAGKAGHAGTLDPLASGLLLVLFGEATKFAGPLLDADKEYLATVKLGERTSTADAEGEVLESRPVAVSESDLQAVLAGFRGEIEQVPPMHSALKREGIPLYRLARRGKTVERAPRRVGISTLEVLKFQAPTLQLRVVCSKGTYIRVLAEDIGEALGCGGHLSALRRTACGGFRVEQAATLESLQESRVLPLSALVEDLPHAEIGPAEEARLRQGQALKISGLQPGVCALVRPDGGVIGLGSAGEEATLRPLRLTSGLTQTAEKHIKSAPHTKTE